MAFGLETIAWQAKWLAPYQALGESLTKRVVQQQSVAKVLNEHALQQPTCPVRFVPQSHLPKGTAYEAFIYSTGLCPTRDGLHDFFNALVWFHLPRTKALLNQWQATEIERQGIGGVRGSLRDALTLFDENVALMACPDALWEALTHRDWQGLFVHHRELWDQVDTLIFGHALLEKLVHPRKGMCAHVLRVPKRFNSPHHLDLQLAEFLSADTLATKPYQAMPVLGIPGWCAANESPGFYQDLSVFRPAKSVV